MLALVLTLLLHSNADSLKIFRAPEVVVTSSRNPVSPQDSPTKIVNLDVKQLSSLGFANLGSILSYGDGLYVKDYGPSQLSTISIRGTGDEETLFMIDGVRINSVQNGVVDLFLVPISEIGNVEISEGGSSSLFGADAMGGVVNLNTTSSKSPHVDISLGAGSYGYQRSRASVNERLGRAFITIMAERTRAVNDFRFNFSNGPSSYPMTRTGADFLRDNEFVKVVIPAKESSTSIVVSNMTANRGTPGPVTGPFYIGTEREYDGDLFSVVNHKQKLGDFLLSASGGFTYSYLRYVQPPVVPGGYFIDDFYKMLSFQPNVQLSYSSTAFEGTVGIDGEQDRGTSSEMSGTKNRTRTGAFASGVVNFKGPYSSEVHLFPSARIDWYSDFGSSFNPKLGLNLRPVKTIPVNLRASAGTSFRAPTFNELYYAGAGNPSIKPERSVNYDAGIVFSLHEPVDIQADVDYYVIDIRDGIVWQPSTGIIWRPVNYQKTLSQGVELSAQANYRDFLALRGTYSFGRTVDLSDPNSPTYNKQLIYLPQEQASVVAAVSPWITTFSAALRYVSFRYVTVQNDEFLPGFTTVDLSAGAKIHLPRFDLTPLISVKNLFNENYQVIPQYPMPLRTFYIDLGIKFNQ